ncbi:unnamed protein product [Cercospora beticola]|nr:unnamed protein product [Cercospora beticola]
MSAPDATEYLPQSSNSPHDSVFSPSVSLEQFINWNLPNFANGEGSHRSTASTNPMDCTVLQDPSPSNASTGVAPSPGPAMMHWNFDRPSQKRHPSQALCASCSDRSAKLSLHASHSFWPLATQSAHNSESTMSIGMDDLLAINRDTIENISGILDCTCSQNILLFEKCSTSIGRVIDWYAGAFLGHDMVIAATVRIGSYVVSSPESRNQASAIVLSEMHNLLLPLLDRLGTVYQRHQSMHGPQAAGVGDPKCHWARVNSFFCSIRRSAQATV